MHEGRADLQPSSGGVSPAEELASARKLIQTSNGGDRVAGHRDEGSRGVAKG
jgi:hypothetical protein